MKHTKYPELKSELKALAKEIKKLKYKRDHWWDFDKDQWWYAGTVYVKVYKFRHKHIAYCMLRGRKYKEIELSCHIAPDWRFVEKEMARYGEVVCNSA
ncbi:MAG: hypothetical protein PVG39_02360 [Desulfobacteraceae bacterium]|jgi:hypothetical protein